MQAQRVREVRWTAIARNDGEFVATKLKAQANALCSFVEFGGGHISSTGSDAGEFSGWNGKEVSELSVTPALGTGFGHYGHLFVNRM